MQDASYVVADLTSMPSLLDVGTNIPEKRPPASLVRERWTGLELRHLITLAAVGREASFSRAAEALGYTQSAVSQQISRLEHITGTRLVERPGGPRPVSLTPAGRLLAGPAAGLRAPLARAGAA